MDEKLASLTLDKAMVEGIVNKAVQAAVVSQLEGANDLIPRIAQYLINGRVDRNGNPSTSSYETTPAIEFIFTNQMKIFVQAAIAEYIERNSALLKKKIGESLKAGKLADVIIGAMIENAECNYTTKVDIQFKKQE